MNSWRLSAEYHESGKLLGTVVLGEPHTFVGFTSMNPILFSL